MFMLVVFRDVLSMALNLRSAIFPAGAAAYGHVDAVQVGRLVGGGVDGLQPSNLPPNADCSAVHGCP